MLLLSIRRFLILAGFLFCGICRAQVADACFVEAGSRYQIDPVLLWSIAMTESRNNNAVVGQNRGNADRTGHRPVLSEDLGTMQINSGWLPLLARYGITRDNLLGDRCLNIKTGAWVLAGAMRRYGSTWMAVGAYNAACRNADRQTCEDLRAGYVRRVWRWYASAGGTARPASSKPLQPNAVQAMRATIAEVGEEMSQ